MIWSAVGCRSSPQRGNPATRAAAVTTTIPIVFTVGIDPVQAGIVASFARPGANITGITTLNNTIGRKWLGLFHDLLPSASALCRAHQSERPE